MAVHLVLDKDAALSEIFRVLKPGGKVGITTSAKELSSVSVPRRITDDVLTNHFYEALDKSARTLARLRDDTATSNIQPIPLFKDFDSGSVV